MEQGAEISLADGITYLYQQQQQQQQQRSVDRLSISSSSLEEGLTSSPIDLICRRVAASSANIAGSSSDDDDPSPLGWPLARQQRSKLRLSPATPNMPSSPKYTSSNVGAEKSAPSSTELELMKERFSKLLLGEDMSGSGKGVCTALAISNAITNLAASVFCELWKLEPISHERKTMWKREMDWLLSVCDHIVEFVPSFQNVSDGTTLEVMISRPRSDILINLPALRKLDAMLLEALDSFKQTEFWYVDQGAEEGANRNQMEEIKRQEDKWWLPVPKIPTGGLSESARKDLQHERDCINQILKAAMAINEQVLSEMQVPDVYYDSLPKSAKSSLGERLYNGLRVEHYHPEALFTALDVSTEHNALEVANRIQAAVHIWRRYHKSSSSDAKVSRWSKVKDLMAECDGDKKLMLIERAESLLVCLRHRFPGLPQTVLDVNKIQFNKDIGQAILESYSRVLESLAFAILSRIDDILYIADMTKRNVHVQATRQRASINIPTRLSVSMSTPFATPSASPGSGSTSPSPSPSPSTSPVGATNMSATTVAAETRIPDVNQAAGLVCPSFLGSLCNMEAGNGGVKEAKKPVARPWLDFEQHKKSFYSPPGRD